MDVLLAHPEIRSEQPKEIDKRMKRGLEESPFLFNFAVSDLTERCNC